MNISMSRHAVKVIYLVAGCVTLRQAMDAMDSLPALVQWIIVFAIGLSPILTVYGVCIVGRRFPRRPSAGFSGSAAPDPLREISPHAASESGKFARSGFP
jgi:hypothetical protein